ncbi:hypothetical protein HCH_03200 [Hahella chejuensis KCTC 2396]|uniref:Uncharacterized protein n=1 Tax=Hahella chejuensis (strain KCTC 2396) TaxID=349521 RepID=Q2SHB2_HAHCH|nr:hypothetical protein HCH_03200 [Hahella chejuensis KCTC 2396]
MILCEYPPLLISAKSARSVYKAAVIRPASLAPVFVSL